MSKGKRKSEHVSNQRKWTNQNVTGAKEQKYRDEIKEMINEGGSNAILAGFLRLFMKDLHLDRPGRYGSYMQDYLLDPRNGIPNNRKDITSNRGNLTKEFGKQRITWKVLCKGFRFMKFIKVKFTITAWHVNGQVYEESLDFGVTRPIGPGEDPDDVVEGCNELPYVASLDGNEDEENAR